MKQVRSGEGHSDPGQMGRISLQKSKGAVKKDYSRFLGFS